MRKTKKLSPEAEALYQVAERRIELLDKVIEEFWNVSAIKSAAFVQRVRCLEEQLALLGSGEVPLRVTVAAHSEAIDNPTSLTDRGTFGLGRF